MLERNVRGKRRGLTRKAMFESVFHHSAIDGDTA